MLGIKYSTLSASTQNTLNQHILDNLTHMNMSQILNTINALSNMRAKSRDLSHPLRYAILDVMTKLDKIDTAMVVDYLHS